MPSLRDNELASRNENGLSDGRRLLSGKSFGSAAVVSFSCACRPQANGLPVGIVFAPAGNPMGC